MWNPIKSFMSAEDRREPETARKDHWTRHVNRTNNTPSVASSPTASRNRDNFAPSDLDLSPPPPTLLAATSQTVVRYAPRGPDWRQDIRERMVDFRQEPSRPKLSQSSEPCSGVTMPGPGSTPSQTGDAEVNIEDNAPEGSSVLEAAIVPEKATVPEEAIAPEGSSILDKATLPKEAIVSEGDSILGEAIVPEETIIPDEGSITDDDTSQDQIETPSTTSSLPSLTEEGHPASQPATSLDIADQGLEENVGEHLDSSLSTVTEESSNGPASIGWHTYTPLSTIIEESDCSQLGSGIESDSHSTTSDTTMRVGREPSLHEPTIEPEIEPEMEPEMEPDRPGTYRLAMARRAGQQRILRLQETSPPILPLTEWDRAVERFANFASDIGEQRPDPDLSERPRRYTSEPLQNLLAGPHRPLTRESLRLLPQLRDGHSLDSLGSSGGDSDTTATAVEEGESMQAQAATETDGDISSTSNTTTAIAVEKGKSTQPQAATETDRDTSSTRSTSSTSATAAVEKGKSIQAEAATEKDRDTSSSSTTAIVNPILQIEQGNVRHATARAGLVGRPVLSEAYQQLLLVRQAATGPTRSNFLKAEKEPVKGSDTIPPYMRSMQRKDKKSVPSQKAGTSQPAAGGSATASTGPQRHTHGLAMAREAGRRSIIDHRRVPLPPRGPPRNDGKSILASGQRTWEPIPPSREYPKLGENGAKPREWREDQRQPRLYTGFETKAEANMGKIMWFHQDLLRGDNFRMSDAPALAASLGDPACKMAGDGCYTFMEINDEMYVWVRPPRSGTGDMIDPVSGWFKVTQI